MTTPIDSLGLGFSVPKTERKGDLGQEDFLHLMLTQLKNQDPFKPMESGEFLGQLAQFGTVQGLAGLQTSFDGLATKVNHHRTVSEYFTPAAELRRNGFDRLIRLGIGLEEPEDLMAALNWTLHHAHEVTAAEVDEWQRGRAASLGLGPADAAPPR